jgi:hypothetical protein
MRRFSRAAASLVAWAPLGLALPALAGPEIENAKPPAAQERPEAVSVPRASAEAAEKPAPPPVPDFDASDPSGFSVIDPNDLPPPGEMPTPAETEEKAKREAVGRQSKKLEDQSARGMGQSYFGGGLY